MLTLQLLGNGCGSDGRPVAGGSTTDVRNGAPAPAAGGVSSAPAGGTDPVEANGVSEPGVGVAVETGEGVPVVGARDDEPAPDEVAAVELLSPELDAGSDAAPDAPIEPPLPVPPAVYNPCPPSGTDCTIMPLGDSITDGFTVRGGYRIPFFQRAHREGKQFIFVGSQVNGPAMVDNVPFPQRHEGHSAHTIYDAPEAPIPRIGIANYIPRVIPQYHPDIVLLMIGTNDVDGNVDLPNAPNRLGTLIDSIIELDAHSLIVVAQITPTMQDPLNQRIVTYNAGIPAVVKSRADAGKHVLLVDMYEAFTRDPQFKANFLADRLHPNSAGYQVMSDVWNSVVHDLLH
jgi:GDSL-like Lipase/Acylhydrolase family